MYTLSLCLGFAYPDSQASKLNSVHTLHCILYTVHYEPLLELSTAETSQG